ncbi:MAG: acyltransferase [Opitutaceae bacterium]|nr:acyltransferase [Opitutaceae bacterium]
MVIVWHYLVCQLVNCPVSLRIALGLTWSGVDLFFVLSGFLIGGILLDHRDSPSYFRVFYLRRVCRVFPLYFLLLGLFAGLMVTPLFAEPSFLWLFHNPLPLWSYGSFTQNIAMGLRGDFGPHWLGITWSLAVEEQFYLLVPFLIYYLPRRYLSGVLVAAILAAPLFRHVSPGFHVFVGTLWRADSLLAGVLLAVLVRWPSFVSAIRDSFLLVLFAVFLLGAVVLSLRPNAFGTLDHLWLAGLYSTAVLIAHYGSGTFAGRLLGSPVLVWFGQLSYGIYMFHQAVSGLLHGALRHRAPTIVSWSDAVISLCALGLTLLLAALSYRYLESPILRYGHRYHYSDRDS